MAEIFDKSVKKTKPGILFLTAPFADVLVMIEEDGSCKIVTSPKLLRDDAIWRELLEKRVNQILKSL